MTVQIAAASSDKLHQTASHLLMGEEMEDFRKYGHFYVVILRCYCFSDFHFTSRLSWIYLMSFYFKKQKEHYLLLCTITHFKVLKESQSRENLEIILSNFSLYRWRNIDPEGQGDFSKGKPVADLTFKAQCASSSLVLFTPPWCSTDIHLCFWFEHYYFSLLHILLFP